MGEAPTGAGVLTACIAGPGAEVVVPWGRPVTTRISSRRHGPRASLCVNRNADQGRAIPEQGGHPNCSVRTFFSLAAVCGLALPEAQRDLGISCLGTKDSSRHRLLLNVYPWRRRSHCERGHRILRHYKVFLSAARIPWASPSTSPVERIVSICVWGQ